MAEGSDRWRERMALWKDLCSINDSLNPNTGMFLGPVISFSLTLMWKKLICFCLSRPLHDKVAVFNSLKGQKTKPREKKKKGICFVILFIITSLAGWVSVPSNRAGEEPEGQEVKKKEGIEGITWCLTLASEVIGCGGRRQAGIWVWLLWVWEVHQKETSVHWAPGLPVLECLLDLFLRHDYLSTELELHLAALRGRITPQRNIFTIEHIWDGRIYP